MTIDSNKIAKIYEGVAGDIASGVVRGVRAIERDPTMWLPAGGVPYVASRAIGQKVFGPIGKKLRNTTKTLSPDLSPQTPQQRYEADLATGKAPLPAPQPGAEHGGATNWVFNPETGTLSPVSQRTFSTVGGVSTRPNPVTGGKTYQFAPTNYGQGTGESEYGREVPAHPSQFAPRPDYFNNPPGYGAPGASYMSQPQNNLIGMILQPALQLTGVQNGIGAALKPASNFMGLTSGLLNILPGLVT